MKWIAVGYVMLLCGYMLTHRIWFSPDQFFVFVLVFTLIWGNSKKFLRDWTPFLLFLFGYETLRGLVPYVSKNVHIWPLIQADERIFGFLPSIKLQQWLYTPNNLHWYDYAAVFLYIMHFVSPMFFAFVLWIKDQKHFKAFTTCLLVLSYATFATYLLYPAMPPWMASAQNFIPPLKSVTSVVMSHFFKSDMVLPSIYSLFGVNPVAAMPSLHAAFPTMIVLYMSRLSKKLSLLFAPYMLGVWFSVVYLGEHYVIDVLVGAVYALAAFLLVVYHRNILASLRIISDRFGKVWVYAKK